MTILLATVVQYIPINLSIDLLDNDILVRDLTGTGSHNHISYVLLQNYSVLITKYIGTLSQW